VSEKHPVTVRRELLAEAQRHFLRAAERCMTALDQPEKEADALAEALFFGALGVYRSLKADDAGASLGTVIELLTRKKGAPEVPG